MKVQKLHGGYAISFLPNRDVIRIFSDGVVLAYVPDRGISPEHAVDLGLALRLAGEASQQLKDGATQTVLDMWLRDIDVKDKAT